jgi:hypothetical protein
VEFDKDKGNELTRDILQPIPQPVRLNVPFENRLELIQKFKTIFTHLGFWASAYLQKVQIIRVLRVYLFKMKLERSILMGK